MRPRNAGILNVGRANGRVLDLQAAHRAGLQLAAAHGIERQLCTGNGAAGQLPGRDHATLQRIGNSTQRDGCILLGQAVVGILRHAHGHLHANAPGNHPYRISQKDIGKRGVLPVLLRI